MNIRLSRLLAIAGVVVLTAYVTTAACATTQAVQLNFSGEVNGEAFSCGSSYQLGNAITPVVVNDFRLYVSDIVLTDTDGNSAPLILEQDDKWQLDTVALLDFESGTDNCSNGTVETNSVVRGTVPAGDYTGVEFSIGVPFTLNHGDPTLQGSPLNLTAMFWNWRGGYKFMKFDMTLVSAISKARDHGEANIHGSMNVALSAAKALNNHHPEPQAGKYVDASAWVLHLGSTRCASATRTVAPSECLHGNRIKVKLDAFDSEQHILVIDPAAVLATSDVSQNAMDTSPGCMSFPEDADCEPVFALLGLGPGGKSAGQQVLVTVR